MARFQKLNDALARMEARLDELEAQGVDITKLPKTNSPLARKIKAASRRERERFVVRQERGVAAAATAATAFFIGQAVRCRRGEGKVVEVAPNAISIDLNGSVIWITPTMVQAL
ncbi:hypothetical protein DFR49_3339 [Hephaestia caeni]|uniref:Uncharacterized protein n=1 Tax=Hephaestia caeni TaxID=645617 RepID=A0A397NUR7_9SPHN|nr:hypothetical protein [Hephaestia caeni]RIA37454.1 hypothetical protein DFR49_3339 [Hephaestia caeni]